MICLPTNQPTNPSSGTENLDDFSRRMRKDLIEKGFLIDGYVARKDSLLRFARSSKESDKVDYNHLKFLIELIFKQDMEDVRSDHRRLFRKEVYTEEATKRHLASGLELLAMEKLPDEFYEKNEGATAMDFYKYKIANNFRNVDDIKREIAPMAKELNEYMDILDMLEDIISFHKKNKDVT